MMGLRIFMVSSDGDTALSLAKLFQKNKFGSCVGYASTENQALRWLDQHPADWDVLIADTTLEEGSGLGVLAHCPPPHPHQKIVMLSYLLTEKMQMYCSTLGADLTLDKLHGFEQLMDKMAQWSGQGGVKPHGCAVERGREDDHPEGREQGCDCDLACC